MKTDPVLKLKLLRQKFLGALGISGNVPLRLVEDSEGLAVRFEGRRHAIPDVQRWKLYRKGWAKRMRELQAAYGVDRYFPLHSNSVVLDIGANTGDFTLGIAAQCARVYCFEPDPQAYRALQRNVAGLGNVVLVNKVVWKADEPVSFGLETARADSSVFSEAAERVEVPGVRLKTFIEEQGIERVTLVKCDAEGAEPEVLEGVLDAAARIDGFAFDTGAERGGTCTNEACEKLLRDYGFEAFTEPAGGRQMTYGLRR